MANLNVGRKSGFLLRRGVMRRESLWFFVGFSTTALAASATAFLAGSLNAAALALRPFTIVRTHLRWFCKSDQSAATEQYIGNIGLAVVSDQAIAIGTTAVPTPATDQSSDLWFLHQSWIGQFNLIGSDVSSEITDKPIDSKAMRKVEDGQDLAIVIEAGIGGQGVEIGKTGRILIKLH